MVREMVEVKEPRMMQFTTEGQSVEGYLLRIERVNVKDKSTIQYVCKDEAGDLFTFLATYDIARKLRSEHRGRWIMVRYEGEDGSVQTQGNKLRRFKVCVEKENPDAANDHGLHITDEDIPF